jgi:hypothetical protein
MRCQNFVTAASLSLLVTGCGPTLAPNDGSTAGWLRGATASHMYGNHPMDWNAVIGGVRCEVGVLPYLLDQCTTPQRRTFAEALRLWDL